CVGLLRCADAVLGVERWVSSIIFPLTEMQPGVIFAAPLNMWTHSKVSTHTHVHTLTFSHTHTHTHTHMCTLSLSHTHMCTLSLSHTPTHMCTLLLSLLLSLSCSLSTLSQLAL